MAKGQRARSAPSSSPIASDAPKPGKPSSLLDTRVVDCGLRRTLSSRVDLIYIDPAPVSDVEPPFNSNRAVELKGETKEKRAFDDRHAATAAYIEYMRPHCMQLARVLNKTGSSRCGVSP